MGRTQSFDRDTVIRAARSLFWGSGYESASIPELEQVTGLSRSSIYNAFGSKRGLFDATVQSYLDEVIRPRLRPLQADSVAPDAIVTYLTGLRTAFEAVESLPAANGCLLLNSAGAPISRDHAVAQVIADYRTELHTAISRGVAAYLRPGAETRLLNDTITSLVISGFTLVRIDSAQAGRGLTSALHLLESARANSRLQSERTI